MKVSVSLPESDLAFVDEYAASAGVSSRSAVIQKAIRLLRNAELGSAYAQAWDEWRDGGSSEVWEESAGDGAPKTGGSRPKNAARKRG